MNKTDRVIVCDSSLHATVCGMCFGNTPCRRTACSHALLHCSMCLRSIVASLGAMCVCFCLRHHIVMCERCCHVCGDWSLVSAIRQFRRVAKRFDDNVTMLCLAVPCKGTFSSLPQSILLTVVSSHHGDAERICADCRRWRRFGHCADFRHGERVCADCRR